MLMMITLVAWGPFIIFLLMLNNDIVLTVTHLKCADFQ